MADNENRMAPILFPETTGQFINLQTPDRFQPKGSTEVKEEYRITLDVDPEDPEWKKVIEQMTEFQNARLDAMDAEPKPLSCLKRRTDKNTGEKKYSMKVHSKSRDYFEVVDKNNRPYSEEPWGGSRVKVFATPEFYDGFGGGMTLYLVKVMVVENSRESGGSSGGGYSDPFASAGSPDKSDIPF